MRLLHRTCLVLSALYLMVARAVTARNEPRKDPTTRHEARVTVNRGLEFLQKDAAQWRKDHDCSTCHHGVMTVWALSEARGQGYDVAADALAETVKWTK